MKLGDIIASYRRKKRINQKTVSEGVNISISYLSSIENNARKPSKKLLMKISKLFDVPISVLLFYSLDESLSIQSTTFFYEVKPLIDKMLSILFECED